MPASAIIAVFSQHRHPRLRYVLKELRRDLGYTFRLMTNEAAWEKFDAAGKVTVSETSATIDYLRLPAHPILAGGGVSPEDLAVHDIDGLPAFFMVEGVPDYLACCFYLLSRYEEYEPFGADEHGRFSAAESHAFQHGYLQRPVVREWAALLGRRLRAVFPNLPEAKVHAWAFRPTYDIDILWAYHHRGVRGVAAGLRDLLTGHPMRAWERLTVGPENDPFNNLAFLQSLHLPPGPNEVPLRPVWFWLLTDRTDRRDVNAYPLPEAQKELIRTISGTETVGIHPGYLAAEAPSVLGEEVARLAAITGVSVRYSRQHFLRLRLPDTYRALRNAGITHDYTMGYADGIGWRAGTNLPFAWYDLEKEEATGLTIHAFAAMDVSLKDYLKLGPDDAKHRVFALAEGVRPFGGDFMLLWHNSSFAEAYGWAGWQEVYVEIVTKLRSF